MTHETLTCGAVAERGLVEYYVAERLSDEEGRGALETHLLTCQACREEVRFALVVRAELMTQARQGVRSDHDRAEARAHIMSARATEAGPRRLRRGLLIGLATAATVVLLVQHRSNWLELPQGTAHRGPTQASTPAPIPLQPAGQVSSVAQLRWFGNPGADRYRVRLFDAEGELLWEAQGTDTALALPDTCT